MIKMDQKKPNIRDNQKEKVTVGSKSFQHSTLNSQIKFTKPSRPGHH